MYETDLDRERERLYSRLATVPGIQPMPSIRNWILLETHGPQDLARRINRRMGPGTVSVPRHVDGALRIPVRDPKSNEFLFRTVRELMKKQVVREDAELSDDDDAADVG
jgi:histidinol-phosphate/aromatic aminotransferase/cobyric acid decarboxylase-like protein